MERKVKKVSLLLLIFLFIFSLTACKMGSHNEEAVRAKMEESLYKEYGEEFVVNRIGTRKYPDGKTRYVARIYPKSIIGTPKEGDPYYCAKAGVEKKSFGRLGKVGAGYETVQIKLEAERYLINKIKEIFGKRVLLKPDVKYEIRKEGNDYFSWQIVSGFEELLKKAKEDPENKRLELELYLYIFDRIDNEKEKEERRKQIFDFVQHLKQEGLFKYLKVGLSFIDERVLAPDYREYRQKINASKKVKEEVKGELLYFPPRDLRKEMSQVLQEEINKMNEGELLANMRKIRKSDLTFDGIREFNGQYYCWIYSPKMKKLKYNVGKNEKLKKYYNIKDVKFEKYDRYIFLD
ncbi:hypothetical protein [Halocella sp. SP3-1]|uniref:hypothetical protein n=1 Tax=Halocella sp. SP3-1 TaxID=2382161 RepID=UPI000F765176|nr:hypothetical protein [Halocella sp. SP3-1]AZO95804.1 hypothetical protein D7D81_15080 [Halocella sp. SP3-1]